MRAEGTDQELLSKLDISVFVLCEIMFIYVLDGPYLMKEMDGTWLDNLNTARFTGHNWLVTEERGIQVVNQLLSVRFTGHNWLVGEKIHERKSGNGSMKAGVEEADRGACATLSLSAFLTASPF
jgi:hypothetical protein